MLRCKFKLEEKMKWGGFFIMLLMVVSTEIVASDPDTTGGILKDDPSLAALDSLLTAKFFEAGNFTTDTNALNVLNWESDTVPQFSDEYYIKVFEELNDKTPFNLVYNDAVKAYVNAYAVKYRTKVSRMLGLAELYFPLFEETLDRYNLPLELKYLAIVESALNPNARSRSGATGLWQFMYRTGKIYDLHSTSYLDDRRDPYQATVAACEYFKFLYGMFGDWQLVLAAYNGGPGNLLKAIRRAGGKRDYWEVRPFLRRETQGYVPAFFAVNYVMTHASEHNIYPVKPAFFSYELDTVMVKRYTDLVTLSSVLQIPYSQVKFLNPIFKQGIIPRTKGGLSLVLPKNKMGVFVFNQEDIYDLGKEKVNTAFAEQKEIMKEVRKTHRVKYGETLGGIAARYRCRVSDLRDWNGIRGNLIREGQRLVVYSRTAKKPTTTAKSTVSTTSNGNRYHVVQSGDTLWDIAKKNGITVSKLKELNRINNHYQLKIGTKLKIG
ncbi:MAG: LysM peptidoglycan-binding domain-containing protein [Flavobacteriales bacterium]|nr:LysM peptidoglycan-binding domain-containing protein [Flavobacteriales bacterium]